MSDYHIDKYTGSKSVACPIVVNGVAILFGGRGGSERGTTGDKQISVVYKSGIKRIGTLPFYFSDGKCDFTDGTVSLCFPFYTDTYAYCHQRYIG